RARARALLPRATRFLIAVAAQLVRALLARDVGVLLQPYVLLLPYACVQLQLSLRLLLRVCAEPQPQRRLSRPLLFAFALQLFLAQFDGAQLLALLAVR